MKDVTIPGILQPDAGQRPGGVAAVRGQAVELLLESARLAGRLVHGEETEWVLVQSVP